MANYTIQIKPSAKKELSNLPQNIAERIITKIRTISEDPRPADCKKLATTEKTFTDNTNYRG